MGFMGCLLSALNAEVPQCCVFAPALTFPQAPAQLRTKSACPFGVISPKKKVNILTSLKEVKIKLFLSSVFIALHSVLHVQL